MSVIDVLFPKGRAETVRLLFADPSKEVHLRELCRRSGLTVGTLQRELGKLAEVGLISTRPDGNRLYYRANTGHPIFPELQGIALKTTGLREQIANALDGLAGVESAFVFGSQAAGTAGAESDVDLMVLGNVSLRALAPRLRPLALALGREVNPHVYTLETFRDRAGKRDAFIASVLTAPKLWVIGEADELGDLG